MSNALCQLLRIMRILAFFLLVVCVHLSAKTVSQTITLKARNITLSAVFSAIEDQTGLSVTYVEGATTHPNTLDVDVSGKPLIDFLNQLALEQPFDFWIGSKTIFIRSFPAAHPERNALPVFISPPGLIKGQVTDSLGHALAGASVTIVATGKGTQTGPDGRFELRTQNGRENIQITFTGFESRRLPAGTDQPLTIMLFQQTVSMQEVVVNKGYYTESRKLSTGNVSVVTAADIADHPVSNVLAALDGRVPGMLVTQSSGLPGASFKVEVRGRTAIDRSISNDQPLFIIDGIPITTSSGYLNLLNSSLGTPADGVGASQPGGLSLLNNLNPSDIESIQVLKDADATAIYGSRGANGVILITTKRGKSAKPSINFNTYTGWNKPSTIRMMNTQQYIAMRRQAFANDSVEPNTSSAYDFLRFDSTRYTNIPKLLSGHTAYNTDAELSISGGTENTQFLVGGGYNRQTTPLSGNSNQQRGSVHVNVTHTSTDKKFSMALSSSYAYTQNNLPDGDLNIYNNTVPNFKFYTSSGELAWTDNGISLTNPLAQLKRKYRVQTNNAVGNLLLSYELVKNLRLKCTFGYNSSIVQETSIVPLAAIPVYYEQVTSASFGNNHLTSWNIEPQINYQTDTRFGKFDLLVGSTLQSDQANSQTLDIRGGKSDDLIYSIAAATSVTGTSSIVPYHYQALFGRVNYNWKDKYILNLTARRDGSSRFSPENRFSNFGAIGAAWIFTNERFLQAAGSWLSFGKLRTSYGVTGNDKILDYQYLDSWSPTPNFYSGTAGVFADKLYNPGYHWEQTKKREVALEAGFFKDRLMVSASRYSDRSSNQLVYYTLPGTTGFTSVIANLPALVENAGWEFTLSTRVISSSAFKWNIQGNLTVPKNKLLAFPDLQNSPYASVYQVGQPLNLIYALRYTGVDPQSGLFTFEDFNKDGTLDYHDFQALGKTDPSVYGGIQNSFTYQGWQLDLLITFRHQTGKSYLASLGNSPGQPGTNLPEDISGFWTKPGDHATLQRLSQVYYGQPYQRWGYFTGISNGVYTNASFVRLKNISLSYSLPKRWLTAVHFNSARLYVQTQNLLTVSPYAIGDPETQSLYRTAPLAGGVAGLQLNF